MGLEDLIAQWRERAEFASQYADASYGRLWSIAADELQAWATERGDETLSLAEAAALSGYTPDHLASLIRSGRIPNAGQPHAPRIRRADLPTKSQRRPG